jgi:hypothetical protein
VRLKGLVQEEFLWGATKTVRDSLSPTWNETFSLDLLTKMPLGGKLVPFVVRVCHTFRHCSSGVPFFHFFWGGVFVFMRASCSRL